jgi:putative Holliday junction resolvase
MAFQSMLDGGLKKEKRKNKGLVDKISATLLLQSYLDASLHSKNKK